MANNEHIKRLGEGVKKWNKWRKAEPNTDIDLIHADLTKWNLDDVNFSNADLHGANLDGAILKNANLKNAHLRDCSLKNTDLSHSSFWDAILSGANLSGANLEKASFFNTNLTWANFSKALLNGAIFDGSKITWTCFNDAQLSNASFENANILEAKFKRAILKNANFKFATLIESDFELADLSGSHVYGVSAWNLNLDGADESNLTITDTNYDDEFVTDGIEVAQFIYLLLNNKKLRTVIDSMSSKVVLIIGRFNGEMKLVLHQISEKLRELNYLPFIFDFEKSKRQDFTDTIKTLAGLSRFIIADITSPKSVPLELQAILPDYMVPLVPIIHESEEPFSMFTDLQNKYDWVLPVIKYKSISTLIKVFDSSIVAPAINKSEEILVRKAGRIKIVNV
jgi:uncharacterized protein YjbI with pentapeptide repeats